MNINYTHPHVPEKLFSPVQSGKAMLILVLMTLVTSLSALGQAKIITGTVKDPKGESLPGVSVLIKGTQKGTSTDADGKFRLNIETPETVLVFSFIGFQPQEVTAGSRTSLNIVLKEDATSLDEVVVVGYGTQRKRDVTGAVASFKAEQIEEMPQTTITQSLQGKIPGLNISTNSSNAEGNSNSIQIRGRNSITASNSPLIVVDGIPFSDQLSEINPNDIESMDVLKDASSAAIYGSRAANGVILITTKKGKSGKPQISYHGYAGLDDISHSPDMMNSAEFYQTKTDRFGNSVLTNTEISSFQNGINTDWVDLATRMGSRQQHSLSVAGGSENMHYYISGSYNAVDGIAKNDKFDRYNIRINLDTKLKPWITLGTNSQLGYYDRSGINASFSEAFVMNPLAIPYQQNGSLNLTPWPEDPFFKNPLEGINVLNDDIARSVISNNYIKIDVPFVKGLSYRLNTGYTYRYRNAETYYGSDTRDGLQQKGVSQVDNWNNEDWIVENILDYNRKFGSHNLGFTGLYSAQKRTTKNHDLDANGFPGNFMTNYQNQLATVWLPSDLFQEQAYESQMARLNYSYKGKYLVTGTVRRDGYSAFGANSKYGVFPSVALGWNITEEKFMKKAGWIDFMKLRLSYGKNGNQAIDPYRTLAQLSNQNNIGDNGETAVGFYPSSLGDSNLSWETTNKANFGVDFSLLGNRLNGSVDYYFSRTYDLLLNKSISPVNGVRNILQNIGEVKNNGLDLYLSSINVKKTNFSWTSDLTFSYYRNKIADVGLYDQNGKPLDDVNNRWFIGKPIGVNYSYVFDGIWQQGDDIAGSAQPTAKPGDVRVKDINNDGTINTADRSIIGSQVPDYMAGLVNTFKYRNLSLSFFIRTVQGTTKFNDLTNTYFDGRNAAMNRIWWTADNPINTYPANRDDANPFGVNYFGSSSNSSFIRLNDVTLKYNFPEHILKKSGLSNLEVYLNAKNLATITKWDGLDPELDSQTGIPQTRAFLLGLRFGF